MAPARRTFQVGDRTLAVSNLDKVLYPQTGTTKAEVIHYYLAVAGALIPQISRRPVTRKRWVDGVGTAAEAVAGFFRKDLEDSAPDWIPTGTIRHRKGTNTYPLADEPAVLAWFGQVAALELHTTQWRFGRNGQPRNPDRLVLDLDPGTGTDLADCATVAGWCREILEDMGMPTYPVTSGSKGIHLYAGLDGRHNAEQISAVAHELARALEADHPDAVVSTMRKADRTGKVFLDWSQNSASKTTVSPYSLRGRQRPTVAAPRTWEELADPALAQLEFEEVIARLDYGVDPIAALGADRLEAYRSKRDATRTREPVPAHTPADTSGTDAPRFVIQEHHASHLHWDFRLEHSGVLVSWAVPKGVPLEHRVNRLAVQTEDHPLEYGSFEGTIPAGEYGAGKVTIWDAGTYEREKWREGEEIIAVLHGRKDGGMQGVPRRFALIRTQGMDGKNTWLLQLMKDQPDEDQPAEEEQPADDDQRADDEDQPVDAGAAPEAQESSETASGSDAPVAGHRRDSGDALSLADIPAPMLASPGTAADIRLGKGEGETWVAEMKWDGYRMLGGIGRKGVVLASRSGRDMTEQFPQAAELTELLDGSGILDGELVALDERGRPDFSLLQTMLSGEGEAPAEAELRWMVFDILAHDGRSLIRETYRARREILAEVLGEGECVTVPPAHTGSLEAAIRASRALGLEGVVAKRTDSIYLPGRRGSAWVKIKTQRHQEVVVIGARAGKGARTGGIGSLLVAVPDGDGRLRYAGRVGTGFTDRQLAEIEARLRKRQRRTPPVDDVPAEDRADAWWVSPTLVAEVSLAGRTRQGRVRQAAWRGWREDKDPDAVRWEV